MWGGRMTLLVALTSLASGCASGRTSQQMARLQSQIGLLEERVNQLERGDLGTESAVPVGEAPAATEGAQESSSKAGQVSMVSVKQPAPGKASLKPSKREIQQALKNAGFYQGSVDGKMGPMTREAIKEFQRVHGLPTDGVAGKKTWAKLSAYADLSAGGGKDVNAAEALK